MLKHKRFRDTRRNGDPPLALFLGYSFEVRSLGMSRALFGMLLALLIADASGINSLLVPETCTIGESESRPDSGCPAFCVRCACACCTSPIVKTAAIASTVLLPRVARSPVPADDVNAGVPVDILHIPKPLLT
jgi:hypothetical protein